VLDVDLERERVSLSLKATQEDPWKEFERKYSAGEIIDGQVTKLVPFGAFVRVAAGIEGLVHISEISDQHIETPESVLSVGEEVRVKVIEVDVPRRRISLSMRQVGGAMPRPATEIEEEATPTPEPVAKAEAGAEAPSLEPEPVAVAAAASDEMATAAIEAEPETPAPTPVVEAVTVEAEAPIAEPSTDEAAASADAAVEEEAPEASTEAEEATEGQSEEDISLEAILEDLKRREGRSG
jgi:small subunit ribosomal protein S1